ncbi:MAG: O-antigen ligase family protein [Devosia sp.]
MLAIVFLFSTIGGPEAAYIALIFLLIGVPVAGPELLKAVRQNSAAVLFLGAFFLLTVATVATASSPRDFGAIISFVPLLLAIPAIALFSSLSRDAAAVRVVSLALVGSMMAAAHGLYEVVIAGQARASGNFSAIFFADLGVLFGFVAAGGVLLQSRWRLIFVLGPLAGLACALLADTRGAILASIPLAALLLVFWMAGTAKRGPMKVAGVLLLALVIAVSMIGSGRVPSVFQTITQVVTDGGADVSTNNRLRFYRAGLSSFLDAPLFGHGWTRRFTAAQEFMPPKFQNRPAGRHAHLHNDLLNFASGAGILGVAAYLLSVFAPLFAVWSSAVGPERRFWLYTASVASIGFGAMGLTDSMFVFEVPKVVFIVLSAMIVASACTQRVGRWYELFVRLPPAPAAAESDAAGR